MSERQLINSMVDDRFVIERRISFGSYSEIYLARDLLGSEDKIILKALNPTLQGTPDADLEQTLIENFQNEAVALDSVRHPNIIRRLGHGTALDLAGTLFHYLILEYLPGGDLRQHSPLSFDRVYFYLAQIMSALSHAHRRGVIHRDLKPNNLLLTADQLTVKIADFGVAKISPKAGDEITRVGADIYAPPEHHPFAPDGPSREHTRLTPSADIYSLAKSIYTMLTGIPPKRFERRCIDRLPDSIASQPWATTLLSSLGRATQERPADRYQSVEEFWEALEPLRKFTDESIVQGGITPSHKLPSVPPAPPLPDFAAATGSLTGASARIVISLPSERSASQAPGAQKTETAPAPAQTGNTNAKIEIPLRVQALDPPANFAEAGVRRRAASQLNAPSASDGMAPTFWHRLDAQLAAHQHRLLAALGILLFFASVTAVYRYSNPAWSWAGLRPEQVEVVRDVSFRELPTQQSAIIGWIRSGAKLRVIERTQDNWVRVEVLDWNGSQTATANQGWLYGAFVATMQQ